jgi:hypothetical protein
MQGPLAAGAEPSPIAAGQVHPDGTALAAPASMLPKTQLGIEGKPNRSAERQSSVEHQIDDFNKNQDKYDVAAQTLGRLDAVKDNIATLAKSNGGANWLVSGAGGELRANLANVLNTTSAIFDPGKPPPMDPTKVAAAQDTIKETRTLAFQLVSQLFGKGREPLGVVTNSLQSVPGLENTPLGGMLVADLLSTTGQWIKAQRPFKQDWMARAHDDLTGADNAYTQLHPPEVLIKQVMDKYGLGPDGYKSKESIIEQHRDGLINDKMAYDALHSKGWISDKLYERAKANGYKPAGAAEPVAPATAGGPQ